MLMTLLSFASFAFAQDSVNAHGFYLAPNDGDLFDGLSTWRSETHEPKSFGVNALFEYASEPLVLHRRVGAVETEKVLVDDLTALNLGGFYAPHERVSVTLSVPVVLGSDHLGTSSGMGFSDLRLAGSAGVLLPEDSPIGLGFSVVPFLDLPGTMSEQQLSSPPLIRSLPSGGVMMASSLVRDTWDVSVNLGTMLTPRVEFYNLQGREHLIAQASVAHSLTEDIAVRGEVVSRPSLRNNKYVGTESPAEAMVSLRGFTNEHLGWTVGGAKALTHGASAATWRMFAGLDLSFGGRDSEDCPACDPALLNIESVGDSVITWDEGKSSQELKNGDRIALPSGSESTIKVVAKPCDELVKIEGDKLLLLQPIYFDFDKAEIRMPDSFKIMSALAQTLMDHPEIELLQVATGTDIRGSDAYNQDLSERRAKAVVEFLVKNGIDPTRLTWVGFGESRLRVVSCETEACHEENRYSNFTILKLKD